MEEIGGKRMWKRVEGAKSDHQLHHPAAIHLFHFTNKKESILIFNSFVHTSAVNNEKPTLVL